MEGYYYIYFSLTDFFTDFLKITLYNNLQVFSFEVSFAIQNYKIEKDIKRCNEEFEESHILNWLCLYCGQCHCLTV